MDIVSLLILFRITIVTSITIICLFFQIKYCIGNEMKKWKRTHQGICFIRKVSVLHSFILKISLCCYMVYVCMKMDGCVFIYVNKLLSFFLGNREHFQTKHWGAIPHQLYFAGKIMGSIFGNKEDARGWHF